jgi:hypothetical protein
MKNLSVAAVLAIGSLIVSAPAIVQAASSGIVRDVSPAPVSPDGNVAGRVTDLVIDLDRSMDPSVLGRGLLLGKQVRITLPADFRDAKGFDTLPLTSGCVGSLSCNTAIPLQGWPQNPIAPPTWTVSRETNPDGSNTFVIQALADIVPAPGIKQFHLLLLGFENPEAGIYDLHVEAETGIEGAVETGTARVEIFASPSPRVAVTSINGGPPNVNPIYQETGVLADTPVPYNLLLWDTHGRPMKDVKVVPSNFGQRRAKLLLVRRGRKLGDVTIVGPNGSSDFAIAADERSSVIMTPVTRVPSARLPMLFQTGDLPGLYTVTVSLDRGNSMTFFVNAVE